MTCDQSRVHTPIDKIHSSFSGLLLLLPLSLPDAASPVSVLGEDGTAAADADEESPAAPLSEKTRWK